MMDYELAELPLADLAFVQQQIARYLTIGFDLFHVSNVYAKDAPGLAPAPHVLLIFRKWQTL